MNADKIFKQGDTHKVCQDYAEAYATEDGAVALIADGCSSAPREPGENWKESEFTDWGARLLVRAAQMELSRLYFHTGIEESIRDMLTSTIARADAWRNTMQLPIYALDATLVFAYANHEKWMAVIAGDGVILSGTTDGKIRINIVSFANDMNESMPFYPSYNLSRERRDNYREEAAEKNNKRFSERWILESDGTMTFLDKFEIDIEKPHLIWGPNAQTKFVVVSSDGLSSFKQPDPANDSRPKITFPTIDVLKLLLPFKSFGGEFIIKRTNMFSKDCRINKFHHDDDFSLAGIYLGEK